MFGNIDAHTFILAIVLTLVAGLSTVAGGLAAVVADVKNKSTLAWALGISAGVMIFISFMEILPESIAELQSVVSEKEGRIIGFVSFFTGCGIVALIDRLLPGHGHTHCPHIPRTEYPAECIDNAGLKRQGIMLAVAIAIHNFPEGMATFVSSLGGMNIAIPVVVAIAIHNFPIGIAIAIPIYQATGRRSSAIITALLTGLAEPLGALVGGLLLVPFWSETIGGIILSAMAGIMVYISFDELIPSAMKYSRQHSVVGGLMAGFILMAISLELF